MTVIIRRAYPVLVYLCLALTLAGCATTAPLPEVPAMHNLSEIDDEEVTVAGADPWEGFNHSMYNFNYELDKYFLLPIVNTYEFITPTFAQTGVSNFFNNIGEVRTFYNSLLQAKGEKSMVTLGRFVTNSTIGIGGLFDPATSFGLARQDEDFGQTLGVWGVGTGPYLVLPALGPGTVRGASGFAVDAGIHYGLQSLIGFDRNVDHGDVIMAAVTGLKVIDNRHQQPFRYYGSEYPFEYDVVRFLYRQKRELAVMK